MDAGDIVGHKVDAHGEARIASERWSSVESPVLAAINRLEETPFETIGEAIEHMGWSLEERDGQSVLVIDHQAGSGRWRDRHLKFMDELAASGFEGFISVESMDEDLLVRYALSGGTVSAEAHDPSEKVSISPEEIFGHKFSADGTLTIPLKAYRAVSPSLLESLNRIEGESQPTLEQSLGAAGWHVLIDKPKKQVELGAGDSGMFSGRWRENDVDYLRELAKAGFSGWIQVEGEEDVAVEYTLADGALTAEGFTPERPWEDEEGDEDDEELDADGASPLP